ncbi:helix-turn-helix domain-containing protein [Adhaeribacter aquaticus]|uniref:helix-turn-helix domain-containing protein n=1 Tax=Adhaeribacter aquaticus TaxID=299567 RepID=UPI00041DB744|nr:AraC family transcriptional regulator [Adhaeribacter aquaticus]
MIITSEAAPSPELIPYVRCYTYREFNTHGSDLRKPWFAAHEITMVFFFKDKPVHFINPQTGQFLQGGCFGGVTGLGTQFNGDMAFNGCYSFFEIVFNPTGFHKIFRLLPQEFTNYVINLDDVFGRAVREFYEKLGEASSLTEMVNLTNTFLQDCLQKSKLPTAPDNITRISTIILKNAGHVNVDQLAKEANMSKRNFERHFSEQVGLSPKLFCCVTRFNKAFKIKLENPKKSWTEIANQCGYFDQMHLIKEFKKFAGSSPSMCYNLSPLREEIYTARVGTE